MRILRRTAQSACVIVLCMPVTTAAQSNAGAAPAPIRQPDVVGGYASTHVIVRARAGFSPALAGKKALNRPRDLLAETLERFQVTAIRPVFENGFADPQLARRIGLDRYYRLETPPGTDTPGLVAQLSRLPAQVEGVALDGIGGVTGTIPDDPHFGLQWGLLNQGQMVGGVAGLVGADINVSPAWDIVTGDPVLVLAVLDAGMDAHVEIADRMIPGRNVAADPDNNDTGDVCISHGTHVAGIAAATGNNTQGIAGVDWSCRIMPVRVLNACSGPESYVAEGIIWATDNGADVMNMSLQYYTGTPVLHDAVLYAYAQGKVMISASGNSGACTVYNMAYPARWPETIAVGAINNVNERASFSNCGPELDVVAPGEDVWSLNNGTAYKFLDGTSMATPHVSGTVNLMKTLDPDLTADEIKGILQTTAVDIAGPGFDNETGFGRVNVYAALLEVQAGLADLDGNGVVDITDFLWLLGYWGHCPSGPGCIGDIDRDGEVGVSDFLIMLAVWG
ncbi:MAG: S8 family serine peptidase [Planctomycetota bacterium]|jgi:subtilisin family serine protease